MFKYFQAILLTPIGHTNGVIGLAFRPTATVSDEADVVVSVGSDGLVKVWKTGGDLGKGFTICI